jgi:hypothetical protein
MSLNQFLKNIKLLNQLHKLLITFLKNISLSLYLQIPPPAHLSLKMSLDLACQIQRKEVTLLILLEAKMQMDLLKDLEDTMISLQQGRL